MTESLRSERRRPLPESMRVATLGLPHYGITIEELPVTVCGGLDLLHADEARGRVSGANTMIRIKRTYENPARGDGRRVLVERLWPRGMRKEALAADAWMKDVAPSTELRKWFDHRVERWKEFRRRYRKELNENPGAWEPILDAEKHGTVTLLYSAHDTLHNGAVVLREYLAAREVGRPRRRKARASR